MNGGTDGLGVCVIFFGGYPPLLDLPPPVFLKVGCGYVVMIDGVVEVGYVGYRGG